MDKTTGYPKKVEQAARRPRIEVLGVGIDDVTLTEAVNLVAGWVEARRADRQAPGHFIVTSNPEYVMAARRDPAFRELVNSADLITPDGVGIIGAGKILGKPFRSRVTGVALAEALFEASARRGWRLFLLGAAPGVAEAAAARIRRQYPAVQIVGTWAGEAGPYGDEESLARILHSQAEIVLVAYGMVKQDWWAARNLKRSGVAVAMGVGGVLDYKAGRVSLAPAVVRRVGLEWLYRLYREPWRWRRQLALPRFAAAVALARWRPNKN